jgi:hypothetical protein
MSVSKYDCVSNTKQNLIQLNVDETANLVTVRKNLYVVSEFKNEATTICTKLVKK